jgi:ABC-type nitrate/sulfonate/bicarbonate transport system substrate-binding protein
MSSARLQGADPVMIAGVQDTLDDRLVARPTIKAMEELKGKRIGVFRFGSASHLRLLYLLPRYGLSERDITMLQVGDTPERLIALAGGSIDATLVSPPDHFEALRAGMKILLNLRELNVPYQGSGLVTTQRVLARKRDVARRFLKAYVEAVHMLKTNPDVSKKAFAKYRQTKDEKRIEDAYQTLRDIVKPKPYPSIDGFKTIIETRVTGFLRPKPPTRRISSTLACSKSWTARDISTRSINEAWRLVTRLGDLKLPDGKILILGVITHCSNIVEHSELIAERSL